MAHAYFYVVARDFGFAPNPFHGMCTLATCKPIIRKVSQIGDWVIGVGGARLKATNKCIFAMRISEILQFNEYWNDKRFSCKKPVRNGSQKLLVGDNIYHRGSETELWVQENSHHSHPDGSVNLDNLKTDTSVDRVLISSEFFYFGKKATAIPVNVFETIKFNNRRNHSRKTLSEANEFLEWLYRNYGNKKNIVMADPFDFSLSAARYSGKGSKLII